MSDTTASAPAPSPYLDIIKGLLPSLNQAIVAIVAMVVGITGTFVTQYLTRKPEPIKAADMPSFVTPAELAKAHADISAKLEANKKTMAEIKELIASIPSAPAAKKAPLK